ncbi:PAS domain S-box protein [Leptolyngbya sp. FACHB-321]|uniref:PAS domain S-box protein n=1 Tax=Leptolyngbya sp. FACHB-321 TaxID=2692807 RepID=UPI0016824A57|nr:PAS domain S-box protein [Leptolyngbya sp. FACHB-321]MBD2037837.1 PAS domain S-box protein [Leptolyngbya sp. FACHB-321]
MKRQAEKLVAGGFVLALLVLGGVATGSYLSVQRLIASRQWVEHTYEVLQGLDKIFDGNITVASGRYGYVVSRKETYLADYKAGLERTGQGIREVRRLTSDNPQQQQQLTVLEQVIAKRINLSQQSIALVQKGQSNEARQASFAKENLLLGQEVQRLVNSMKNEERQLLQLRKAATDDSVQQAIRINGSGYLLSFSLLMGVFLLLHLQIRIRQRAEAALQTYAEEIYDLYNQSPCGYHSLDATGTFSRINDTELSWLGYTRDEVLHKLKFSDLATPDSALAFQEHFSKFKQQGWISDIEFELVRKDGTILPVSLSATAIKGSEGDFLMSRSTLFDITDRKRAQTALQQANEQLEARVQERTAALSQVNALLHSELLERKQVEQALLESEKQLRTITNALPVLIAYIDVDQRFRFHNQTYEQWFDCSSTDIQGQHLSQVLGEQAYQSIKPYVKHALSGETATYESLITYKNDEKRWVSATYLPDINQQGAVQGYFALIADINERKLAEQAILNMNEALEIKVEERTTALKQLNDELVNSNRELEQFAYIASHDLQEPLRAVIGYTQLLMQDYQTHFDASAQQYAEYIVDGGKRMQQLIQDLLHYSRVGTRDLVFAPIDSNIVLDQVLSNLQVAIAERQALVTSDPLPTVTVDKLQLTQLLQNLIGNAIKFCRDDAPRVHISARRAEGAEAQKEKGEQREHEGGDSEKPQLETSSHPSEITWLFSIHDNGIGIKPRYLERIFEIFKRLHTRTEFPGTGIGLAVCKKIVDRHGGHIWAESQPGTGTTFYFTIPYHDPTAVGHDRDFAD